MANLHDSEQAFAEGDNADDELDGVACGGQGEGAYWEVARESEGGPKLALRSPPRVWLV